MIFKLDFITQIIYCIKHWCLYSLFILFFVLLYQSLKKRNIDTMWTFQKFNNKINEKRIQKHQSMIPNMSMGKLIVVFWSFFWNNFVIRFCIVLKIWICFSLIKSFPNNHERYSSHLKKSILHWVAPKKVYITISGRLKNSYLKKQFRTINKRFWLSSI